MMRKMLKAMGFLDMTYPAQPGNCVTNLGFLHIVSAPQSQIKAIPPPATHTHTHTHTVIMPHTTNHRLD